MKYDAMTKAKKLQSLKIKFYVNKYAYEFTLGPENTLYCIICCCTINFSSQDVVENHRLTKNIAKDSKE